MTTDLDFITRGPDGKITSCVKRRVEIDHLNWDTLCYEGNLILCTRGRFAFLRGNHYVFIISGFGKNKEGSVRFAVRDDADATILRDILKEGHNLMIQVTIENTFARDLRVVSGVIVWAIACCISQALGLGALGIFCMVSGPLCILALLVDQHLNHRDTPIGFPLENTFTGYPRAVSGLMVLVVWMMACYILRALGLGELVDSHTVGIILCILSIFVDQRVKYPGKPIGFPFAQVRPTNTPEVALSVIHGQKTTVDNKCSPSRTLIVSVRPIDGCL